MNFQVDNEGFFVSSKELLCFLAIFFTLSVNISSVVEQHLQHLIMTFG